MQEVLLMFILSAFEKANIKPKDLDCCTCVCLSGFNLGCRMGAQAGYNALGYALLSSSSLMTQGITQTAAIQSGVIGVAILMPVGLCASLCGDGNDWGTSTECTLFTGSCTEVLDSVIYSLIGAGVQGLFINNVTTPAYIAASSAVGAGAVMAGIAGAVATVIIVGGIGYFCVQLKDKSVAFIPTECMPEFTCRDLVRPCDVGLDVCSCEQMQAMINNCLKRGTRSKNEQRNFGGEPSQANMDIGDIPMAQVVEPPPIATALNEISNQSQENRPELSAPSLSIMKT